MDLFSFITGSKAFLSCLPLKKWYPVRQPNFNFQFLRFSGWSPKKGLQSGKPAISSIFGVVFRKKKGLQSGKPPNSTFLEMISKKQKGLRSQIVGGIAKRLDLKKYFCYCSSLDKLLILCDTLEMASRHTGCGAQSRK